MLEYRYLCAFIEYAKYRLTRLLLVNLTQDSHTVKGSVGIKPKSRATKRPRESVSGWIGIRNGAQSRRMPSEGLKLPIIDNRN